MTEQAENIDVNPQETVTPVEAQSSPPAPETKSKEYNFRKMEDKNRQLENDLQALREEINASKAPVEAEADPFDDLQDDDLVTVAHLNKIAEQRAKKIVAETFAERDRVSLPKKTKAKYEDYDQVVSSENIELLIKEDPDLEHDIKNAKNPYARAYKEIKKSDFYRQNNVNSKSDKIIEDNNSKPISSNSLGQQRPLSHANDYASGSKELLDEMQKYRGGSL